MSGCLRRWLRGYPLRSMYGPVDQEGEAVTDDPKNERHPRIRAIVEDITYPSPPWTSHWRRNAWHGYDYHRGGEAPLIRLAATLPDTSVPVCLYGMTGAGALLWELDLDCENTPMSVQKAAVRSALSWADHTTVTEVPQ